MPSTEFAFDGGDCFAVPVIDNKIDSIPMLSSPIIDRVSLEVCIQFVEYAMFPHEICVVLMDGFPALCITYKGGVKTINFWRFNNLGSWISGMRSHDVDKKCLFEDIEIVGNSWPSYFARSGVLARFNRLATMS